MVGDFSQGTAFVGKKKLPNIEEIHIGFVLWDNLQQARKESKGENTSWSVSQRKALYGLSGG